MNWWQAIVLGIVEGVTEYLPVSSTGHLLLTQRALGIPHDQASDAFAICIQAGAIVAVLGLYWHRVREMIFGTLVRFGLVRDSASDSSMSGAGASASSRGGANGERRGNGNALAGWQLAVCLVTAFVPAAVIGKLFDEEIERRLFSLWPTVAAWLVGGIAILVVAQRKGRTDRTGGCELVDLTWRGAVTIGLLQCVAMWPGTSRSLMTIVGGLVVGLNVAAAVEFSFLLGVITLLAATVYKAKDDGPVMVAAYGWGPLLIGSLAAWISALLAVRWMIAYLRRYGLAIFGWYRVVLALIVGGLLWGGQLSDNPAPPDSATATVTEQAAVTASAATLARPATTTRVAAAARGTIIMAREGVSSDGAADGVEPSQLVELPAS